jgi:hypothetical protein
MIVEVGEIESKSEEGARLEGFSEKGWRPEIDIQAFASILFEILFGRPSQSDSSIPTGIPSFVSKILKSNPDLTSERRYSLDSILNLLKQNDFQIEDGVDSSEVSRFVSWVESAEHPEK